MKRRSAKDCSLSDCDYPLVARGYCEAHYRRLMKYGTPEGGPKLARKGRSSLERFMDNIEKTDACWEWQGGKDHKAGYGKFRLDGLRTQAHRAAYMLLVGPIPDGLVIDHLCRNRGCVNPDHLEPVTQAENLRRGIGYGSASYTHCKHGHAFTKENTGRSHRGHRYCKTCDRIYHATDEYKARKRLRLQRSA